MRVKLLSHKLKSTLAFVGNEEMTESNKKVELLSKEVQDTDQIPGLIQRIKSLCPETLTELQQEFDKL